MGVGGSGVSVGVAAIVAGGVDGRQVIRSITMNLVADRWSGTDRIVDAPSSALADAATCNRHHTNIPYGWRSFKGARAVPLSFDSDLLPR